MRRIFLVLMIVMLPLRGWMGDVMALEMSTAGPMTHSIAAASKNTDATINIANYLYKTWTNGQFTSQIVRSAPPDCPGHAAMADADSDTATFDNADASAASEHCNACNACDICHGVALANAVTVHPTDLAPDALPFTGSTRFTSATRAPGQKPPIS